MESLRFCSPQYLEQLGHSLGSEWEWDYLHFNLVIYQFILQMKKILIIAICAVTQLLFSCEQQGKKVHNQEAGYPFQWEEKEIEKYYNSIYLAGKLSGFTEVDANTYAACKTADAIKRVHDPSPYVKTTNMGGVIVILDVKIPDDPKNPDNCIQQILSKL